MGVFGSNKEPHRSARKLNVLRVCVYIIGQDHEVKRFLEESKPKVKFASGRKKIQ